jgi:ribonuclease-3 family protein
MLPFSWEKPKSKQEARNYSPLSLAYIGDGVFEIMVRTYLAVEKNLPPDTLHHKAKELVEAPAQSRAADRLWSFLSEEEREIFRWGRNAKSKGRRKNATAEEYKKATGLECLFGFLYMSGESERLQEVFRRLLSSEAEKVPDLP